MDSSLVYNIPARLTDKYRGRALIIRSASPAEIVFSLWRTDLASIRFVQLLSSTADASVLESTARGLPVEVVLSDPSQYQHLYNFTTLLDSHPVRVAIPVVSGFSKAVKLAVSLNYAVNLEIDQPGEALIDELDSVLDLYLHRSYVKQPIEFFHTMLLSMYRNEEISLWEIAEENPRHVRYITDNGEETISRRFEGVTLAAPLGSFVLRFGQRMISQRKECSGCEYFSRCGGYFKWPDTDYRCEGIKTILEKLTTAMGDVRQDLAKYKVMGAGKSS